MSLNTINFGCKSYTKLFGKIDVLLIVYFVLNFTNRYQLSTIQMTWTGDLLSITEKRFCYKVLILLILS